MTTLEQAFDGLNDILRSLPGNHHYDNLAGQVQYPATMLHPVPFTDYRDGAEDGQTHVFRVIVLVSQSMYENQRSVLPYVEREGPQSIFAAVEANRSLGGLDGVDAHVREAEALNDQEVAGYHGSGAAITVVVFLSND